MTRLLALAGGTVAVAFGGIVLFGAAAVGPSGEPQASASALTVCGSLPPGTKLPDGSTLTSAQLANASIVVSVAGEDNVGIGGAVDVLDAALTESRLRNDDFGTKGALGLFEETPAHGWGTAAQVTDPTYAATAWFKRLRALPRWAQLAPPVAAQDVERSAFPSRYGTWVTPAERIVAELTQAGSCSSSSVGLPDGFTLPPDTPHPVQEAIAFALAQLGKPYVWGGTGPSGFDCSGLVMMAYRAGGVSLPRTTFDQVHIGVAVSTTAALLPGDLVFLAGSDGTPANPGHVGLFLGGGVVEQAPFTGADVELTPLSSFGPIVAMRRVVAWS